MLSDLQDSTTLRFPYLSDLHNHHDLKDSIIQSPWPPSPRGNLQIINFTLKRELVKPWIKSSNLQVFKSYCPMPHVIRPARQIISYPPCIIQKPHLHPRPQQLRSQYRLRGSRQRAGEGRSATQKIFIKRRLVDAPFKEKLFSAVIFLNTWGGSSLKMIYPAFTHTLINSAPGLPHFHREVIIAA